MPASGSPLGSTPFGPGTPAEANAPPSGKLAAESSARFINSATGDYEINSTTGQLKKMPPVRQRFLLLLKTLKGSSTVLPDLGVDLPEKIDDTFENRVRASIRLSARQMTDVEKVARIDSIVVRRVPNTLGRVSILLAYTDLTVQVSDVLTEQL